MVGAEVKAGGRVRTRPSAVWGWVRTKVRDHRQAKSVSTRVQKPVKGQSQMGVSPRAWGSGGGSRARVGLEQGQRKAYTRLRQDWNSAGEEQELDQEQAGSQKVFH